MTVRILFKILFLPFRFSLSSLYPECVALLFWLRCLTHVGAVRAWRREFREGVALLHKLRRLTHVGAVPV